ncbi:uncharacterized protein LOC121619625 isoform X2 [Chelmon rostratus]|uniref:uncharacterized protein LOC121619625 isoform X2 n=1 Tax=Chelmon rostratus TaxID=109905 RepID=UPI001BE7656E|nr:uncharacterized protein LOC121619625 isoform X2 [Chelmon rostratus]
MEKGSLERFKGNSLEEIEIEDELEPDVEQGNPENGEAEEDNEESDLLPQQSDALGRQAVMETQRMQLTPEQDAREHIMSCRDKPFLDEVFIDPLKGRGVFTRESIEPSTFVVELRGNISSRRGTRRKKCGDTLNNYLFDFSWNGTNWCVDASKEDGTLGRLVNDDHISPNCKIKKIVYEGKPHLCLFAVRKISPGEEITFNYGDSSYAWRSVEPREELKTSQTDLNAASSPEDGSAEDSAEASCSEESCCDDEYVPDDEPSSDECSTSSNNQQCQDFEDNPEPDSSEQQSSVLQPVDASCIEQEDKAAYSSDDKAKDPFHTSKNYCYVCGKAPSKIARHLFTHRKEDPEIAEVFALPLHSRERNSLLVKLRNRGNYKHYQQVLKNQNLSTNVKTFALCLYCKGMYIRKNMWRHMQRCSSNKSSACTAGGRNKVLTLVDAAELTDCGEISPDVSNLVRKMKKDEIALLVWNDPHILQLAQCLCHMNESKAKSHEYITHRLRLMGRLLLALRKKSISSYEDAVKPQNFSKLLEAVRELTGFNEETASYQSPGLVIKLANLLQKIGDINYARALKEEAEEQTTQEAAAFIKMCAEEWGCVLASKVRVNSTSTVPFICDVQLFYQCTEKTTASAVESLTMYESPQVYNALLRVILAQVSCLNKNVVEVSKVTVKSFNERDETEPHEDAAVPQSEVDQILSKHSVTISVMGNWGKKIAVTLTPKLLSAITLLVSKRDSCGVHEDNPFLFARPAAVCMSFCKGHQCLGMFIARCGAKNKVNLRSVHFRKYLARVFQILSLTNEELEQLAKVLGRDIRTNREYYQTPEAAVDVAKILELLSAMQNGSLERFEGKSFEEIDIADELEPDAKESNPENSDAEEENESSLQLSGLSSSKASSRVSFSRKRGRGRKRKKKSENEESVLNDEKNVDDTEKFDGSEDVPLSCDIRTPEKSLPHSNEDATKFSFSDDDEDMNVDFNMDTDEDVRNEDHDGDGDTNSSAAMSLIPDVQDKTKEDDGSSDAKKADSSTNKLTTVEDLEETVDMDAGNRVETENQKKEKQKKWMDVDSRSASAILNTEKKNNLSAVVAAMKQVKILIPKLDIEKLRTRDHISQLSSVCNSVKGQDKGQANHNDNNQRPTSTDINKPSCAKAVQMICSHCKKSMMKGQTAYQKKGFTDVFCSKSCLFEIFPINRAVTKTCHHCQKPILQPLDLIMAAVDVQGTMKDFCSVTCLSSFKTNSAPAQTLQSVCTMCNKTCSTTRELTMNEAVHKFCSDSCLEDFRRDKTATCDNCSSAFLNKPLMLKLKEETKTICSDKCLDEFKEKMKTPHECTLCHTSQPMSGMVHFNTGEDMVELFCTRTCVTSYRLRPAIECDLNGQRISAPIKRRERGKQSELKPSTEDAKITSDSTASAAAESDAPSLVIADSCVVCRHCGKTVLRGQAIYQLRSSPEAFCSASCFSERHPNINLVEKKCHNCFQVIMRPQNVILAPVDDSGTMKELCSNTCLSSVNSKRDMAAPKLPPQVGPRSECRMCAKFCFCKIMLTLDGSIHRLCSDACFIKYHKINNLPLFTCDVCSSVCRDKRLLLKMEDGSKNICGEECLVKFKEKIVTPQLCPTCQTSHQMSDMVENKDDEGKLDFFCSNRCMMVHKAQSFTVSGRNSPTFDENDIKEVKPSLPNLKCIKEEPIDEEYNQSISSSISTEDIKDEPNVVKEDLKIGSVFSLTGDSTSAEPTLTHMDFPESCSNCRKVLMDGEIVYQRKGHTYIFCATPCLLKFYQVKQTKKTCHFCLQAITQSQGVLQAPGDNEETMKDFCSQTCLSSFNYKTIMSTKIHMGPFASQSQCSMCSRYCISKHEIIQQDVIHKICSDPCFLRFCNMNNLSICENCRSHCNSPVMLKVEDGSKKLCSAECLAQFKQKVKTPQPCAMCCTPCLISDMVGNKNSENVVELFCTSSCVMASKIQAVSAAGTSLNCDKCGKTTVPACHLAMSDASIRSFCSLTCAMAFKDTQNAATNQTAASEKSQCDFLKPPEKLPCAQCRRILKTAPQVVQKKGKMNFVCSLACSQEFKRVNNIMGKCEYCTNERIIRDAKRVNNKDCYFCSDGCKMLFCHDLEKEWGDHCHSCAYCLSISKTVVTAQYKGTDETFCSEECNSNYKMLFCHVARCDTCGHEGKLRQSLPMLGEVKHFCDLKCLLHFCNKKVQMVNTVSSPPRSASTAESSPVIANVISLAGALVMEPRASAGSAQHVSVPDIQTKVVRHASVQTLPKEVKNKSMLCTPLVHNKGVSSTTQIVDTGAQTGNFVPKVVVLPVPVPVYVPLPMNMYSQYTPKPVGLPLPLPVPVFLPVTPESPDPTVKSTKETIQPETFEGELNFKSEPKETQDERNKTEDRVVTIEGQRQGPPTLKEHTSECRDDFDLEHQANQQDSFPDSSSASFTRLPPPALEMREDPQTSLSPLPPPSLLNQTVGEGLSSLSKCCKRQQEPFQRQMSTAVSRRPHKLKSQCGVDAWKRWIQWRESQNNLDPISSQAVTLNEDVLRSSATELSDGLCCFITEAKRPNGEPYSPDGLFYLCLSIQQYLFENGRMENIFSDLIYKKFSVWFTKILKGFKPSVTASCYIRSCVEENFLWDCKQLGAYSPIVLLNTLLFFCCKHFGFTTVEQHHQLSFAHVVCYTKTTKNNTKAAFLRFCPPALINEAESDADGVPPKKRKKNQSKADILEMMENAANPLRCPVRLYKFYLSKCPESARRRTDMFYLHPDRSCVPSSPLWFSSTPLDDSTMEAMLVRILTVRELQGEDRRGVHQQTSDDAPFIPAEEDSG